MQGFGGMEKILQQAQEMQKKMADLQEQLGSKLVTSSSGGGMVVVTCSGKQQIKSIKVEQDVIDPNDAEMLEDLILTAVNDALRQSQELATREMGSLTGGLNIPGLF